MFGRRPTDEPGYKDMIKAVFQLWRYFSHCRRGLAGSTLSSVTLGVILTLDNWLAMGGPLRDHVLAEAGKMADAKDRLITAKDRRPVVFVAIDQLERTLATADEDSFLAAVAEGANESIGWMLDSIHKRQLGDKVTDGEKYPFANSVRRQSFWNQEQLKLRESLAHLVGLIMRRVVCDASVAFRASFVCNRRSNTRPR